MTTPQDPDQPGPWDPPGEPPPYVAPQPAPPPYVAPQPAPPQYGQPQYGQPQQGGWQQPPQGGWPQQPPYGQPGQYGQVPYGYGPPVSPGPPVEQCASMGNRLVARIIDGVLVGAVAVAIMLPLGIGAFHGAHNVTNPDGTTTTTVNHGLFVAFLISLGVFALIGIFYEVGMIAVRGATYGKQWMGVKVVRSDNGQVPGWGPSFVRWIIPTAAGFACSLLPLLIYISPFFDNTHRNQGWHDKAASTFVIKAR